MLYPYECKNKDCDLIDKKIIIDKPMSESSREEFCEKCDSKLERVWLSTSIKPSNDKIKI